MDAGLLESYARWRGTRLGERTERIERDRVLDLAGPLAGRRVLDVGCGDGTYALAAASLGARVTAVDRSASMLEAARRRASDAGVTIRFERADVRRIPYAGGAFDIVLAVTVLCMAGDAAAAVGEMARVLAPGGRLVLADLNRWSTWAALRRVRGWRGSETWRRARFHTVRDLTRLASSAGLDVERTATAIYYPPVESLLSLLAPLDPVLSALAAPGAAFVAVAARR